MREREGRGWEIDEDEVLCCCLSDGERIGEMGRRDGDCDVSSRVDDVSGVSLPDQCCLEQTDGRCRVTS